MVKYKSIRTKCCYTCKNNEDNGDTKICSKNIAYCYYRGAIGGMKLFQGIIGLTIKEEVLHVCDLHEFKDKYYKKIEGSKS